MQVKKLALAQKGKFAGLIIGKFLDIPCRFKIIPEQLDKIIIKEDLQPEERELFNEIIMNYEVAIAYDWTYYKIINLRIVPL